MNPTTMTAEKLENTVTVSTDSMVCEFWLGKFFTDVHRTVLTAYHHYPEQAVTKDAVNASAPHSC